MKKISFFFISFCFVSAGLVAQIKTVVVDSPDEFVKAIGSDRIIQLKGSTIYFSEISSKEQGANYRFNDADSDDSYELVIFGVSNMKIAGLGHEPVKIITKPEYGNVLVFENCDNITIENIEAGHGPEKGYCIGGVFKIINSKNFTINNSVMYGSGIEGITAENVTGLKCNNSIIRECSYSIMTLDNCTDFEFNNCEFSDNEEFDLVNISNCTNVKFSVCTFSNNKTSTEYDFMDYAVFAVNDSKSISINDCLIKNNVANFFYKKEDSIELNNTNFENNSFTKGMFYKE